MTELRSAFVRCDALSLDVSKDRLTREGSYSCDLPHFVHDHMFTFKSFFFNANNVMLLSQEKMPLLKIMEHLFTVTVHDGCKSSSTSKSDQIVEFIQTKEKCARCIKLLQLAMAQAFVNCPSDRYGMIWISSRRRR
jgi:hypothetical protein